MKTAEERRVYARKYRAEHGDELNARARVKAAEDREGQREYYRGYYAKNRDQARKSKRARIEVPEIKEQRRQYRLGKRLEKYGLTLTEYEAGRRGGCEICGCELEVRLGRGQNKDSLALDHDHATGRFRGFLCHACNMMLGSGRDDPEILRQAAEYLETRRC